MCHDQIWNHVCSIGFYEYIHQHLYFHAIFNSFWGFWEQYHGSQLTHTQSIVYYTLEHWSRKLQIVNVPLTCTYKLITNWIEFPKYSLLYNLLDRVNTKLQLQTEQLFSFHWTEDEKLLASCYFSSKQNAFYWKKYERHNIFDSLLVQGKEKSEPV